MTTRALGAAALLTLLAGCPGGETPTEPTTRIEDILALTGDTTAGGNVYSTNCATCHGADGTGGSGFPNLTVEVPEHTEEQVLTIVIDGEGTMPAFGTLSDQNLADLMAYMNAEWP
ncbi:MAG: cytochrome c [Alphaproteobacteria bacterium]|nr:cytochrome c [Alphaproteobacteria bacterium]MCB9692210.1 cytochrome c [Alphaproteobacteria bacterium]